MLALETVPNSQCPKYGVYKTNYVCAKVGYSWPRDFEKHISRFSRALDILLWMDIYLTATHPFEVPWNLCLFSTRKGLARYKYENKQFLIRRTASSVLGVTYFNA